MKKRKEDIETHDDKECPECAKEQKHVRLVEHDGRLECRECRYYRSLYR